MSGISRKGKTVISIQYEKICTGLLVELGRDLGLLFRDCNKLGEGGGVSHCNIGEYLAVDLNPRLLEAIYKPAI